MLRAAIAFFVLALISAGLGYGYLATDALFIAKIAFILFLFIYGMTMLLDRRSSTA